MIYRSTIREKNLGSEFGHTYWNVNSVTLRDPKMVPTDVGTIRNLHKNIKFQLADNMDFDRLNRSALLFSQLQK